MLFPIGTSVEIISPDGSASTDLSYTLEETTLLSYLSSNTRSTILSVNNFGSSTSNKIFNALQTINNFAEFQQYLISETILNSIADNSQSSTISGLNFGTSDVCKVIIILGEYQPTALTPTIKIDNGTNYYSLSVSTTLSPKKLEFDNIPVSFFQSGFYVKNNSGSILASSGNSIFMVPL
jgi:hypothetical protein